MRHSLILLVVGVACGGCELILGLEGDPVVGTLPDAAPGVGAQPDADPEVGPQPACAKVTNFGDLGVIDGEIRQEEGYLSIGSLLDEGPPQDAFVVELFAGLEPFVDGLATGTFEITGLQTDYETCGVCASVFGDLSETAAPMVFLAQSGTITVTSIEGTFTGSYVPAGNTASYVGFSFNQATGEVTRQDGCVVTGGGASWNKAIPVGP